MAGIPYEEEPTDEPRPPHRPRRRPPGYQEWDDGGDAVSSLIPYHNVRALLAYYFGVFGLIPGIGLLLGPAALVLGILGLSYAKNNPRAKGMGHAITGIVLGILDMYNWVILLLILVGALMAR
jgi:hypothetical protein